MIVDKNYIAVVALHFWEARWPALAFTVNHMQVNQSANAYFPALAVLHYRLCFPCLFNFGFKNRSISSGGSRGGPSPLLLFFRKKRIFCVLLELSSQNSTFMVKPSKAPSPPPLAEGLDPPLIYMYL